MNAFRWIILVAAVALFPIAGCDDEDGETTVIEDREPDVIIEEDDDPDIVVEEDDDGFSADIDVDDGEIEGEVKVED